MTPHFYETRQHHRSRPLAHDLAVHIEARQHTEKAIILCSTPSALMGSVRKYWLRLARNVQRQRSSTLNADKILRYTHAISNMQFMDFSTRSPASDPNAQVYFAQPDELHEIPLNCYTLYVTCPVSLELLDRFAQQLPANALVVDYNPVPISQALGLLPKSQLTRQAMRQWSQVAAFFEVHGVDIPHIAAYDPSGIDDALDRVLGAYHEFLTLAAQLQRWIDLAQPANFNHRQKQYFELCTILAYRVQALTSHMPSQSLMPNGLEDTTFFLHERKLALSIEFLREEVARHRAAGRERLAVGLQRLYGIAIL